MDSTTHLREQVMINQFVSASGCSRDQAQSLLQSCNWQLERALSMFFQDGPHFNSKASVAVASSTHAYMHLESAGLFADHVVRCQDLHSNSLLSPDQSTPHLLQNTPATPESFPDLLSHFSTFKLNNGQSGVNSNSTSTSSTNANAGLDGKSQISPLVSHIQHHYHNYPSSNLSTHLVHNMK